MEWSNGLKLYPDFTLVVCSNKSSIAEATSGTCVVTTEDFDVVCFVEFKLQSDWVELFPRKSGRFCMASSNNLRFFLVELICSTASIELLLVPADWSLGMVEWIGNWDMLSLAIIGAAWVGNWLTVHKPAALSWAVTSFGRYKSRETILLWKFCIQTKSFHI